jgi:ABC-type Fe3+-siderophore transport system permease subunit
VLLGIGILIWVPFEDSSELGVLSFSGAICTWFAVRLLISPPRQSQQFILRHILVGAGVGLILSPLVVFLMVFKSGIHGHGLADFTVDQMVTVLSRTPYFALGGLLVSLGIGIWRLTRQSNSTK